MNRDFNMERELSRLYKDKTVLITGGAGFIGSNLAKQLSSFDCKIIIYDSFHEAYGANLHNFHDIPERSYSIVKGDVRDKEKFGRVIEQADLIFHLAAQVSYIDSLEMPRDDYELSAGSTLILLEKIRTLNRKPKVVFSSSRMVLGRACAPVISEDHPTNPLTLYGVHKLTSEKYLQIYGREFGIPYTILRITNPYGPKQQIKHSKYSLVGWFIRRAIEGKEIEIFGDGKQKRDYIYIDDIVHAFTCVGVRENTDFETYNLGTGVSSEFAEMVRAITGIVPGGRCAFVPWPENYERIETGDLVVDTRKLEEALGWRSVTGLKEGIARTYDYLKENFREYAF